jgi:acyl carrier protein
MEIKEFIEKFAEAIEVENAEALAAETEFHELEEWSSLSVMLVIAFFDEEFDKQVGDKEIRQATTIQDLYNIATA